MIDEVVLDDIAEIANDNIEEILSALGLDIDDFIHTNGEIRGVCPIHDGANNTSAFCYNINFKYWRCYTRNCHNGRGSIFGLIGALLAKTTDRHVKFMDVIKWVCGFVGYNFDEATDIVNWESIETRRQISKIRKMTQKPPRDQTYIKPFPVTNMDQYPTTDYFKQFGITDATSRKFYIRYCPHKRSSMYHRAFAPVLNETGKSVIGVTGRITLPVCPVPSCGLYHFQGYGCPSDGTCDDMPKWKHFGFNKQEVIYNFHNLLLPAQATKTVVITEGVKDLWLLDQNGVNNVTVSFGTSVSHTYVTKLLDIGVDNIICLLNGDTAGSMATKMFIDKYLHKYFNIQDLSYCFPNDCKDVGDMKQEDITNILVPLIKRTEQKWQTSRS